MILIKANPELKNVYKRLITTLKLPVTWNDVFVVKNNLLILAGDVRSLIFNFENKKIYTSILEIPTESSRLESMPSDSLLNNVMNITLYAFGKWGTIGGLKVDKDYETLNTLFSQILRPVSIETGFGESNLRFYNNGVQLTYEDMMMAILRLLNNEGKLKENQSLVTTETTNRDSEASDNAKDSDNNSASKELGFEEFENDYEIGLWHNLSWKKDTCDFKKAPKSEADAARSRIGNNFYITNYVCPKCEEKLYMGVYPVDKELLIDTEEGRVFMARTYSCHNCNTFYTPRPKKLLQEGDIYVLKFDQDKIAYEDYLDILGSRAERTTNPNFNEFESERNLTDREAAAAGNVNATGSVNIAENVNESADNASESKLASKFKNMKDQLSKGGKLFTKNRIKTNDKTSVIGPDNSTANMSEQNLPAQNQGNQNIKHENIKSTATNTSAPKSAQASEDAQAGAKSTHILTQQLAGKTTDELKVILSDLERREASEDVSYMETVKDILREKLTAKYDARISVLNNLSPRQLSDLRNQIDKETVLSNEKKTGYLNEIDNRLYKAEKDALAQKLELSKKKSYAEIEQIIADVEKRDIPDKLKQDAITKLNLVKSVRANREVEHLMTHMPLHMDRKQLAAYIARLDQYKEVDLTKYRSQLDQKLDMAENEEIAALVKRGGKKDRTAWWNLYDELQNRDYKEENKAPYLEKIHDKIRQLDEDAIERICPSIVTLSFAEGLQAYEEISKGVFLPELKTNTLEMIQRRLTKLKTDESVQLMRKLKSDMEEKMTDCDGFYFYNAREEMKMSQSADEDDNRMAMLCAINGYAAAIGPYEYPLMVCDISRARNGREGFVLTPDNIFYHTFFKSGIMNIPDIEKVLLSKRLFSKGIYIKHRGGKKEKLPNNVKQENQEAFVKILDDFATYLQEKPESRSIAYMAKEKHEVIHCYRCGFVYKGSNVCPKCGSKTNH
ncbi:MAG: hypothetical protein J1D87_07870 [Lachnospiraceae bacterium]|nr:hypothetical protein [Lachnospiraceae bacterium]